MPETEEMVRRAVQPLVDGGADKIVLGCTHYPFLRDVIARVAGDGVEIIDSSDAVARRVATLLDEMGLRAEADDEAEYRFITFADEEYEEKLRRKAFSTREK
jgi:glutamate racemase